MTAAPHPRPALRQPLTTPLHATPVMITPWYGGTNGGVAVAVEGLVEALHEQGTFAPVIRLDWEALRARRGVGRSGEPITDLCVRGSVHARGTLRQRTGFTLRKRLAAATLERLVQEHGVRVAHFHFAESGMEVLMQLARQAGLGIVTTFHGSDVNVQLRDPATEGLVRELIALSDRIVAVSDALARRLLESAPAAAERTSVIYNAIPAHLAHLASDAQRSTPTQRWDGLLVGKLIRRKGGDVLIDAVARLVRDKPDLRVAIAGSGEEEQAWRDQARRLHVADNVVFLGELAREDLLDAYRRTRVVVATSRDEGLPMILFESQWLGIPAVATAVGGIPEMITDGENGFLVPSEDPDATAAAWHRLLSDEELHRSMSATAAARAHERFAPSVMADAYQRLYDDVAARAPGAR